MVVDDEGGFVCVLVCDDGGLGLAGDWDLIFYEDMNGIFVWQSVWI